MNEADRVFIMTTMVFKPIIRILLTGSKLIAVDWKANRIRAEVLERLQQTHLSSFPQREAVNSNLFYKD